MLLRTSMSSCVIWLMVASIAIADEPPAIDLSAADSVARKAEQNLRQSLQKKIKVEWTDTPLCDVLASIGIQADVSVRIDSEAFAEEGVSKDESVTLNLGETSAATALHFVLRPLGLEWSGHTGLLEVTTQATSEEVLFTRVYDVAALCKVLEPQLEAANWRAPATSGMGMGGMAGGAFFNVAADEVISSPVFLAQFGGMGGDGPATTGSLLPVSRGWRIAKPALRAEMALLQLLQAQLWANWRVSDGRGGECSVLPGRLIVLQDYRTQTRIQALLEGLEAVLVQGVKARTIRVVRSGYPAEEDAAIVNLLADLISLDVESQPVDEVLAGIFKPLKIRYWLDKQGLKDEGVAADQPASARGQGIALDLALKQLLTPVGLTYVVREGTLVVTTQAKADEDLDVQIHNCAGITNNVKELIPILEKCSSGRLGALEGEPGRADALGTHVLVIVQESRCHVEVACLLNELREKADPIKAPDSPELIQRIYLVQDQTAIVDLMRLLPEMIPGWDSQRGSVQQLGRCLSIKQPTPVHERVGDLIDTLNTAYGYILPKPTGGVVPAPTKAAVPATEHGPTAPLSPVRTP